MNFGENIISMKKTVTFLSFIFLITQLSIGQDIALSPTVIASGGGFSESREISLSWTLGELAVTTLSQGEIELTQGFQQAFVTGTGIQRDPIQWNINAYPNPVQNELHLQFHISESKSFLMEMQDISGKILSHEVYKEVYENDVITLNLSDYSTGIYFLRVATTDRSQVRIFTINKK